MWAEHVHRVLCIGIKGNKNAYGRIYDALLCPGSLLFLPAVGWVPLVGWIRPILVA